MCGIAGWVYKGHANHAAASAVRSMIARQRHRGPDGEGFYNAPGASLGHCRLAIIDLSETGHQPMPDCEGRYWITFNGEIYNYIELGDELRSMGYPFRGKSDTEVILAAYKMWGTSCIEKLRGMFAFAIWDDKTKTLFGARDRLGIKPFHYWVEGDRQLAFASEIKALLEFLPEAGPNVELVRDFLAWSILDHHPADTMVAGIKRLPPGHAMMWRAGEELALWQYWSLSVTEDYVTTEEQESVSIAQFKEQFENCISLHLRSDVPVGTSLSGGLDSSAIACVVSAELRKRGVWRDDWQHTFTAWFDEPGLDERPFVDAVVSVTGCKPHFVIPRGEQLVDELDTLLWHQDEPVSGTSVYAQYCVARLAREHGIKVLLDGQGADEQLAGYRKFILVYLRQLIRSRRYVKAGREAAAFLFGSGVLKTSRFVDGRRYLFANLPETTHLWSPACGPGRPEHLGIVQSLSQRIEADMTRYSLPVLLRYEDRNMMAFGIESRVPFVDHCLVEWLAKLPSVLRLSGGWSKRILREAFRGVLPEAIRTRKGKLYFSTPESIWLAGPLSGWLRDTLAAPRCLAEVVDLNGVRTLLTKAPLEVLLCPFKRFYFDWPFMSIGLGRPLQSERAWYQTLESGQFPSLSSSQKFPFFRPMYHILVVFNHKDAKKDYACAGIFADRQVVSLRNQGLRVSTFDIGANHSLFRIFRKYLELRSVVRRLNPDLIHGRYGTIVGIVAAFAGKSAVISYCGGDLLKGASVSLIRQHVGFCLSNIAALKARRLICVSEELRQALWWRRRHAIVIPDGIDLDLFSPGPQDEARKALGWPLDNPVVIFNDGNDPKLKGLDVAGAAMKVVRSEVPDAELRVMSNVEPKLMPLYYRAADALLSASKSEGSPNVVKEALACNLPVVSTPVGDVSERLTGVHPSAVVPRDPVELAHALISVLRSRQRSNGREHVVHLSLDHIAKRVMDVYREILSGSSSSDDGCA